MGLRCLRGKMFSVRMASGSSTWQISGGEVFFEQSTTTEKSRRQSQLSQGHKSDWCNLHNHRLVNPMEIGLIIYPSWDHGDLETRDSSWHQYPGTWQSHSWSSYEPQSSSWQGNVPECRGEHDKFEDCGYNCMLFQKKGPVELIFDTWLPHW